jgi:DNA-binding CsgD family transcriptional regulator
MLTKALGDIMDAIRLPERDLAELLIVAARCAGERSAGPRAVGHLLDVVTRVVPCELAVWSWYHLHPRRELRTVAGGSRRAEVRGRVLRPAGVVSELVMELSHEVDDMSIVILMRERAAPFDEHDRLVMRLLRPHVDAALRPFVHPRPVVSRRELDVLRLVGAGLTNAQVARRLGIAEATVAKHLEHVFARTGARSRAQAVAMCAELLEDH